MSKQKPGPYTLEMFRQVAKAIDKRLPLISDPDASLDDVCVEIEITWREWALLKVALAQVEDRS
jgi:hypothetical protein